jgi:hypothetical protein
MSHHDHDDSNNSTAWALLFIVGGTFFVGWCFASSALQAQYGIKVSTEELIVSGFWPGTLHFFLRPSPISVLMITWVGFKAFR